MSLTTFMTMKMIQCLESFEGILWRTSLCTYLIFFALAKQMIFKKGVKHNISDCILEVRYVSLISFECIAWGKITKSCCFGFPFCDSVH